jgi:exo-beta-1,3-glucanase (GH17 family)
MASYVNWIGVNVFPWWEDKYSGIFPCTTAAMAADFHLARLQNVKDAYLDKEVVLTEFGWPAGPAGYRETNLYTGQKCGIASEANQNLVVSSTLAKLKENNLPGIAFEAFREKWMAKYEGKVGPFWGVCLGTAPYKCKKIY